LRTKGRRCMIRPKQRLALFRCAATVRIVRSLFSLFCAACILLASGTFAASPKAANDGTPVFRVFGSGSAGTGGAPQISIAAKQPLMVISTPANVQLSTDRKAVRLTLNSSDARRFAEITRKHRNELLILETNGRVLEAMQVGAPVTNGRLDFSYPDDAAVADYLRKRFRLK
jgi:hypothetical protein